MACHAVQMWSLTGLVAAFLDLTIAYLLLCGSAAAYLASKFLGCFGLSLPCPCDGVFMNIHSSSLCFNRLLIEFPIQKVSDVQLSVRQKFPFSNSVSPKKYESSLIGDVRDYGIPELEGEASCSSSISDSRESADMVRRESISRTGKIDMKGKGVLNIRPKSRLRHRKGVGSHGKNSSIFRYPPERDEVMGGKPYNHSISNKRGSWFIGYDIPPVDDAENYNFENDKAPKKLRGRLRTLSRDKMSVSPDEDMHMKKSALSIEELQDNEQGIQDCGGDENSKIKLLQQALEEERAARAALCIDLEEERSAAASAADEAMAMILRLQEEKASIEMEARQYKRMIEEKSAYDDEEMNILEEILVRREKEKLFLENEVEALRQMVSRGNEQFTGDFSENNDGRQALGSLNGPHDDPVSFLDQLTASADKSLETENECADDVSETRLNSKPAFVFGMESPFQHHDEQSNSTSGNMTLCKEIIYTDKDIKSTPKTAPECEKSISCQSEDLGQVQEMNQEHKLPEKVIRTCYGSEKGDLNFDPSLKQQAKNATLGSRSSSDPILDPHVQDIHIIDDGINLCNEATKDKGEQVVFTSSLKLREADCVQSGAARERVNVSTDAPSSCRPETEAVNRKRSPEVTACLPPIGRRSSSRGLRRSSSSSVDTEMLKIDYEIIQLQDRLKLIQEGRGKLGFSSEHRESKSSQLRILEDIAQQIQEIRRSSGPEKAARQASLPSPNSKGLSKRRRSRSVSSSGFQMSSEGTISSES